MLARRRKRERVGGAGTSELPRAIGAGDSRRVSRRRHTGSPARHVKWRAHSAQSPAPRGLLEMHKAGTRRLL